MSKLEMVKFFVRLLKNSKMSTPSSGNGSDVVFNKIIDEVFAKYDTDLTGEVEYDELHDDMITDVMTGIVRRPFRLSVRRSLGVARTRLDTHPS